MANPNHVEILCDGVVAWNDWRQEDLETRPDLSEAHLHNTDLSGANLTGAKFNGASFRSTNLSDSDLHRADLRGAIFRGANLTNADFKLALVTGTIFGDVDLSVVRGLESVRHWGPSTIGVDTVLKSRGIVSDAFLRGCGLPDGLIKKIPGLVNGDADQFHSCFISYSSNDEEFATRLHADLQAAGVRCWFDKEDIKIGEKIRDIIYHAIRSGKKILLILSGTAIASEWVEDEVNVGFEEELKRTTAVLFPVMVDGEIRNTDKAWAAKLRNRHIGNFLEVASTQVPTLPVKVLKVFLGMERQFPHLLRSDHSPFWEAGIPAMMWTDTSEFRNPHYHRPSDLPETLDYGFLKDVCSLIVAHTMASLRVRRVVER